MEHGDREAAERARLRAKVRAGYDEISRTYRDDLGRSSPTSPETTDRYHGWMDDLTARLRPGDRVLDLGCGAGVPAAKLLADAGLAVTGVDFSSVQIERARALVPAATFVEADMTTWDTDAHSFEAIVSLYALIHVPLHDQRLLLPRLTRWLVPGGLLLATVGLTRWTGVEDYFGTPMFWDHADTATYLTWLRESGFDIIDHRVIPEGAGGHTLVLAALA